MIQIVFHLEPYCQRTIRLFFAYCESYFFHSLVKTTFLVSKGLLYKTWFPVDVEFLFSCSIPYLTRSLRLLVSTRGEIPYLRASVYYSLFVIQFKHLTS